MDMEPQHQLHMPAKNSAQKESAGMQQQQQQQQLPKTQMHHPLLAEADFDVFKNYALHVPFDSNANLTDGKLGLVDWYHPQPPLEPATVSDASSSVPAMVTASRKRRGTIPQEIQQQPRAFFGKAQQHCELYSGDKSTRYMAWLSPQVDRGFFMSDKDWTCYRRNYFQVSCTFSLVTAGLTNGATTAVNSSAETGCIAVVNGEIRRVVRFLIGISAHIAEDGKVVELVQHTPKRDKGPQMTPQPQPALPTDAAARRGPSGSNTTCFERIQFKTATANNGKRRAAQQYYTLEVLLLADCDDGGRILAASSTSAPIVVRGRSPGHYADAAMHHRTASSTDAHQWPQQMGTQHDDSSNSTAVAAAIAAAAGYDFSAGNMVQALSGIGAPPPHPQEILDLAQDMSASASLPGMHPSHSGIMNPVTLDAASADLSFIAATMAGSTAGTDSPHCRLLDIHPPPSSSDPSPDMPLL